MFIISGLRRIARQILDALAVTNLVPITWGVTLIVALSANARAGPSIATLRNENDSNRISGLIFQKDLRLPISDTPFSKSDPSPFVTLQGWFNRPGWNLLLGRITIPHEAKQGRFEVRIPLRGRETPAIFFAVGPKGEVESARFMIVRESPATPPPAPPKRFSLVPGIGYSLLSYRETTSSYFFESAITAKVSANYALIPGRLSVGVTCYGTALPLGSNMPGITARFLGANLRLGWTLPFVSSPWSVTLMTGGYYTTMLVQGNNFGFADLMGPQIFVLTSYALSPKLSVGSYVKFAFMGDGTSLAGPQNREVAVGLSLTRMLEGGHPFSWTVDIADLGLTLDGVSLRSSSYSFGMSYGL